MKYQKLKLSKIFLVGIVNTICGYSIFSLLLYFFSGYFRYSYLAISIVSNILSISIAFMNYKFFIFQTKGNYMREYFKFYITYAFSICFGLIMLPFLVEVFHLSPYIAGFLLIPLSAIISFIGHSKFSFKNV